MDAQALLDKVLEAFHAYILRNMEADWAIDAVTDTMFADGYYDGLYDAGYPKNHKGTVKFFNNAFKAKYGTTMQKLADKTYDEAHEASLKTVSNVDRKRIKYIGDCLITIISPLWMKQNLVYNLSGKRVTIKDRDGQTPVVRFSHEAKELGFATQEEFTTWLESMGVEKVKRPKHKRPSSYSFYD